MEGEVQANTEEKKIKRPGPLVNVVLKVGLMGSIGWNVAKAVMIVMSVAELNEGATLLEKAGLSTILIAADLATSPSLYLTVAFLRKASNEKIRDLFRKNDKMVVFDIS